MWCTYTYSATEGSDVWVDIAKAVRLIQWEHGGSR